MKIENLRERYAYDPPTGNLVSKWAKRPRKHYHDRNQVLMGFTQGTMHMLSINGTRKPYTHWVWYYHHGQWPKQIHLLDPDKGHRIENLTTKPPRHKHPVLASERRELNLTTINTGRDLLKEIQNLQQTIKAALREDPNNPILLSALRPHNQLPGE